MCILNFTYLLLIYNVVFWGLWDMLEVLENNKMAAVKTVDGK